MAADFPPAYSAAIRQNLPETKLVFDRFPLVKLLHEHLTELRRELPREATDPLHQQVLKGTRWLLLKRSADLDPQRDERRRLQEALQLNESLATAYDLQADLATKEMSRVWQQPGTASARIVRDRWIAAPESSGIKPRMKFARTLQIHREGILHEYDQPLSTRPLEGTNNQIKLLQRQAYGYNKPTITTCGELGTPTHELVSVINTATVNADTRCERSRPSACSAQSRGCWTTPNTNTPPP